MFTRTLRRSPINATSRTEYVIGLHQDDPTQRRAVLVHVITKMANRGKDCRIEGFYDATLTKEDRAELKTHLMLNVIHGPLHKLCRAGAPDVVDIEI